jgi:ubiquinone/menaquinone biosynthesis C-methylase UbiE
MEIQTFAKIGLKRNIPRLIANYGDQLELGPGKSPCGFAQFSLEYPEWDADSMPIPFSDSTIDVIHAYHFLEHVKNPINLLNEISRVLKPGGHANIVVPHAMSELAIEDLDHKSFFHEDTFKKLFANAGYEKHGKFYLEIHTCFLMGVAYRNICIFAQLVNNKPGKASSLMHGEM